MRNKNKLHILAGIGIVSAIGAVATAIIGTRKSCELISQHPEWDKKEKIKHSLPYYIPTGALTLTCIGSIVGIDIKSTKELSRMSGAYLALSNEYNAISKAFIGTKHDSDTMDIHNCAADEDDLYVFHDNISETYVWKKPADILDAECLLNKELQKGFDVPYTYFLNNLLEIHPLGDYLDDLYFKGGSEVHLSYKKIDILDRDEDSPDCYYDILWSELPAYVRE